jgi:hypothetical protein
VVSSFEHGYKLSGSIKGRCQFIKEYSVSLNSIIGKPKGKRPRRTWENNIKIVVKKTGSEDVDWIHLAPDVVQWWVVLNATVALLRSNLFPSGSFINFSRRILLHLAFTIIIVPSV